MHGKLPPSTPKCSLYAKTLNQTQIPLLNVLGPFPDEPFVSLLDRILFLLGGGRLVKFFNLDSPLKDDNSGKRPCVEPNFSGDESYLRKSPTYVIQKSRYCQCDKYSERTESRRGSSYCRCSNKNKNNYTQSSYRQECGKVGAPLRILKRSFSLCSLACRKFKKNLSSTNEVLPDSQKWLWTKVKSYHDGCQVYEVFKESNATDHPNKFDTFRAPKIIFVILPSGIIMPFETLPYH